LTCAMSLHDPCDGDITLSTLALGPRRRAEGVPLCRRHYWSFNGRTGPFRTWTRNERANWVVWASKRAQRMALKR
jgi:hypothetical protein